MAGRSIYLSDPLVAAVDDLARREFRSRSSQIALLLRRGLVAVGERDPLATEPHKEAPRAR